MAKMYVCVCLLFMCLPLITGCRREAVVGGDYLSQAKINDIVARSYSNMVIQQTGPLWDDRVSFTNYVFYLYWSNSAPVLDVMLTDSSFEARQGFRFHKCIYEFDRDRITFVPGAGVYHMN